MLAILTNGPGNVDETGKPHIEFKNEQFEATHGEERINNQISIINITQQLKRQ